MNRINRAYVKRLEDLILRLDDTLSELDLAHATASMERDMPLLRRETDRIRAGRSTRKKCKQK